MAKGLTAQQIAAKWAANAGSASGNYVAGVQRVTSSPMAKAAANLQAAAANYSARVADGSMAAALNAVSNDQWKAAVVAKGGQNYTTGIQNGQTKMAAAQTKWTPIRNSISAQVQAMPNQTYAQRQARAVAMMNGMHAAKTGSAGH